MIINDLDGYYIVFDTKNWNTELDTLTIYTIHDLAVCKFLEMWPNTDGDFFERLKDDIVRCKSIVTCSEATKKDIVKFAGVSPDKIEVIYWAILR